MSEIKKSDCTSVEQAQQDLGIVRNTLNAYLNALNIQRLKFPFDRRSYITNADYARLKQFVEEAKG